MILSLVGELLDSADTLVSAQRAFRQAIEVVQEQYPDKNLVDALLAAGLSPAMVDALAAIAGEVPVSDVDAA